ncbi:putative urease [Helianthus annuus]|nr:putative urease [Helianthus annuus]
MKLSPREVEKLILHNAGFLAQKRLTRAKRLNYPGGYIQVRTDLNYTLPKPIPRITNSSTIFSGVVAGGDGMLVVVCKWRRIFFHSKSPMKDRSR